MADLLHEVLDAHGGMENWSKLQRFTGHMSGGGPLFERVKQPAGVSDVNFEGSCHDQRISQWPIGPSGRRSEITPESAILRDAAGKLSAERNDPVSGYPSDPAVGWDDLSLAYFAGYAMWNYLTAPFIWARTGVETEELDAIEIDGGRRRRLLVRYPADMMTHSREETFYISDAGLIVRVDYAPEVTGNRPAANFASEHRQVEGGLIMATRRVVKPRLPNGEADDLVVIAVDIDRLEYA